jgi:hypothetical protein
MTRRMVAMLSFIALLLISPVVPQRKFRLFNAFFTDCGK